MSKGTHFEILAMGSGSWQVQAVVDRQDAAVEQAHDMHRLEQDNVFKVVKVEFDNGTGEFREREICKVGKPKAGSGRYSEGLDAGPNCMQMEDVFSPAARRAVRRVLRNWLDSTGVTVLELLHHPDYLTRLENTGSMLQSAVQRAAMAQSKATGQSLHERQRVLFRLVDEVLARARRLWRDEDRPRFDGSNLAALIARIEQEEAATYLFNTAICDWLAGYKTPVEKLDGLVQLVEQASDDDQLHRLDGCLADFLEDANVVAKVLGDQSSLGDALRHIAALVGGEEADPQLDISDSKYAVLKQRIREDRLSQCRKTLIRRLVSSLEGQRPLSDGGLADEARINADLQRCLKLPDGSFLGGSSVEAALVRRSDRFVNPDAIGRLLDGVVAPNMRVRTLLNVELGVLGEQNKRRFGEYIVAILRMPDNIEQLSTPEGPPAVHMRELATLQRDFLNSGASEKQKQEAGDILDKICVGVAKSERIFEKLSERSNGPVGEAIATLRLCAAGTFTEGLASHVAHERILNCLKAPSFLEEYLRGADDVAEKRSRLQTLEDLIVEAKVPETPLTKAVSLALR